MITGYNTEIKHRGRLFHVQTEDKGLNNPVIESLIYIGGEILDSVRSSYKERLGPGLDKGQVLKLMEEQHQRVLGTIKEGKYDPKPATSTAPPAGEGLITQEHTLDEVILSLLASKDGLVVEPPEEEDLDRMELELLHGIRPMVGTKVSVELFTRTAAGQAVPQASVTVKLVSRSEKPLLLFQGTTDQDGLLTVKVTIPDREFENGSLVIQSSSERGVDEIRRPLVS